MAATGKKSKKTKWVKASVTNFIADTTVIPATNNWADSVDEEPSTYSSYASSRPRPPVVLPSASRAARGDLGVDDESIPRRPPYIAHISNLPYDVDESAIMELFEGLKINNLRLPREGDRLKGFGNVEFEDRESLVSAMNMPDLTVGGRRIRIEVSNQDNERRMGRNNRGDRDREYDPERTMGDWRSGPRAVPDSNSRARPMERDGMRDRDRDRERESSADNKPGAWRDAERTEPPRAPYGGRDSYGRDRERGYGGRDGFRTAERDGGGGGFGNRESRGFGSRGFGDRDREIERPREADSKPRERPKLNLLPRTVPREVETPTKPADGAPIEKIDSKPAPKPVSAEKVFGAAKPVDTAAKEREIEERLRKQEEENRRAAEEKERWSRRNDHSDDRRAGARRDDRDRGYRSNYRDRRDYSREDKDKRDYSKEDRERNDSRDRSDRRKSYDRDDSRRDGSRRRDDDDDRRDNHDRDERPQSRDGDRDRRSPSPKTEQNGRESRSRDRRDADERPLPKMKEQEKPNFVASNKFSFLEDADDVSD